MVIFHANDDLHLSRRDIEKLASLIHGFHGPEAIAIVEQRLARERHQGRRVVWQRVIEQLRQWQTVPRLVMAVDAEVD